LGAVGKDISFGSGVLDLTIVNNKDGTDDIDFQLSGLLIQMKPLRERKKRIDKIKPNLGYVKGNVRVICWRANRLKSDATLDELLSIVDYVKRESATCN